MAISNQYTLEQLLEDVDILNSDEEPMSLGSAIQYEINKATKKSLKVRKESEITLILKITPKLDNTVMLSVQLKKKFPQLKPDSIELYVDKKGNMFGEDPYQQKLFQKNNVEHIKNQGE